jgi:hypothetical protein
MSRIVIWDLDNCLSDDGLRIPLIDWRAADPDERYRAYHAACGDDFPNPRAREMFDEWRDEGADPVFVTGRPEAVRRATEAWLRFHLGVSAPRLFMRPNGDRRGSVQLKRDIVTREIDRKAVVMAYDDHAGILQMYRDELGLRARTLSAHNLDAYRPPEHLRGLVPQGNDE